MVLTTEHESVLKDCLLNILNSLKLYRSRLYTAIALELKLEQRDMKCAELALLAERTDSLIV